MYNKDQWISSFEDHVLKLRPHTSSRLLVTAGLMAWNRYGKQEMPPDQAAAQWSAAMDQPG